MLCQLLENILVFHQALWYLNANMLASIFHYCFVAVLGVLLANVVMLLKGGRPSTFATDLHALNSFAMMLVIMGSFFFNIDLLTPPWLECGLGVGAGVAGIIVCYIQNRRLKMPLLCCQK